MEQLPDLTSQLGGGGKASPWAPTSQAAQGTLQDSSCCQCGQARWMLIVPGSPVSTALPLIPVSWASSFVLLTAPFSLEGSCVWREDMSNQGRYRRFLGLISRGSSFPLSFSSPPKQLAQTLCPPSLPLIFSCPSCPGPFLGPSKSPRVPVRGRTGTRTERQSERKRSR